MTLRSKYFYGNEISAYGLENGYVDYSTLAKAFDAVLNNNIISVFGWDRFEQISGFIDHSEELETLREQLEELEECEADTSEIEELEQEIEELENDECEQPEIFQYYIVSDSGAEILQEANEIVFYSEELDLYVWGVTHYGTHWSYVLTNIKLELDK